MYETVLAGKAKMMSVIAQYEKKIEKLADELEVLEGDTVADYDYGMPYRTALDKVIGVLKDPYITWVDYDVFEQQKFFNFLFEQNLSYDKKEGCRTPKYTVLKRVLEEIEHSGSGNVDPGRIELPSRQCECRVLPLYHGPTKIIADPRFLNFRMFYRPFHCVSFLPRFNLQFSSPSSASCFK